MEGYDLNDRELKIVMKKLNKKQENLESQFSELRSKINEQSTKEVIETEDTETIITITNKFWC